MIYCLLSFILFVVLLWRIEFIVHPIRHIVFDIGGDAVHLRIVADDMVVETGLPGEIEGVFVGEMGYGRFNASDNNG